MSGIATQTNEIGEKKFQRKQNCMPQEKQPQDSDILTKKQWKQAEGTNIDSDQMKW